MMHTTSRRERSSTPNRIHPGSPEAGARKQAEEDAAVHDIAPRHVE